MPHGATRWRLAELRIDHLWYPAGEADAYATIKDWHGITLPDDIKYHPEVPL